MKTISLELEHAKLSYALADSDGWEHRAEYYQCQAYDLMAGATLMALEYRRQQKQRVLDDVQQAVERL